MIAEFGVVVIGTITSFVGLPIDQYNLETVYEQGQCVEFLDEAVRTGWEADDLPRLMRVMFRESRCIPTACGETDRPDLRECRDWGLMQINDYSWKTTIRSMGLDIHQMYDPFWNLFFARYLFDMAERVYGCGWQPWNLAC